MFIISGCILEQFNKYIPQINEQFITTQQAPNNRIQQGVCNINDYIYKETFKLEKQ